MTRRVSLALILALCTLFTGCGERDKPAQEPAVDSSGLKVTAWNLQQRPNQ
jgi:hypothetical protein